MAKYEGDPNKIVLFMGPGILFYKIMLQESKNIYTDAGMPQRSSECQLSPFSLVRMET